MSDVSIDNVLVRLKEYRKAEHLSQSGIAKRLGVGQTYYSQVESGAVSLSYHILNGLYSYDCDIDYIITGNRNRNEDNLFMDLLRICDNDTSIKLYKMMIAGFFQMWDWNMEKHWEKCLYSELRAMNVLNMSDASFDDRLYYIRLTNRMSQQKLANILGIGRTKCGKCERGQKHLDAELMLFLYLKGYCLPTFFFEEYVGVDEISYLLNHDKEKKVKYYAYVSSILTNIAKNDKALEILQRNGVI